MTLEQFELYMNKVEDYAAELVNHRSTPYLCHCFSLIGWTVPRQQIVALEEWIKPYIANRNDGWMFTPLLDYDANVSNRLNALFLFEQICLSEKLYINFAVDGRIANPRKN